MHDTTSAPVCRSRVNGTGLSQWAHSNEEAGGGVGASRVLGDAKVEAVGQHGGGTCVGQRHSPPELAVSDIECYVNQNSKIDIDRTAKLRQSNSEVASIEHRKKKIASIEHRKKVMTGRAQKRAL